ncbi:MAG: threonine--tRNA ligase, partial [Atopobiaceae bacterium]|nr:threonine--tRNA ligase [Atopobiaceae bacterium]
INGIAFASKADLDAHLAFLEEAKKRDHRRIGQEMELFMMADEGPGFPFWLPNGMRVKNALMDYWHEMQDAYGYDEVQTPIILSRKLWETSGHWDHYKENMYTTLIDEEDYAVKPMNCPGACLIYKSKPRSYRELPLKLAEAGLDHRHELRGALHGLFRVRSFTQDDAHLFVRPDQITEFVTETAHLITSYYKQFGFPYHVELSTRPENSMGADEDWELAEAGLKEALESMGVEYILNEGDGAFYGPKIDFHLQDCLGRTWQCGTIQLDFQLPQNFELEYTGADGEKHRPIMIHRAGFGSFERFIGMLTEQYAGKFPTWLAPCQVKILPVSEKTREYALEIGKKLRAAGVRVKVDERDEKIGYKIREARAIDRVPYMLILGEKERDGAYISVRDRSNETVQRSLDEFIAGITTEIAERR